MTKNLKYLSGYPETITSQVARLIEEERLGDFLLKRYPKAHEVRTDKALYSYVVDIKNDYIRKSQPLSKVVYDDKINVINHALGLHTFVSRVQGGKLKAKNEIRIASVFKGTPIEFLRMIAVHELAHLKEKDHNKAFYSLCRHMEPSYHQLELDMRIYLTHLELIGRLY
ncbi:M48 metallopeptidase family protein [Alkalimarinus alittae]|uniref:M48 family metallopeptidase n=1 Tax=Alkalimarinus alittae TaxID=2961619 RepID=A0ABY6N7F1_9ALTE|nr:M48 family metallopeptidase [Alkalimarinus alittae]UZE97922.1 M48 family metallopeptidase [Alkalimarinus alittae]